MLEDLVDQLSAIAPIDHIKVIALLFLSVPLSLVFPFLPSSKTSIISHLYSALPAVWYLWFVLKLRFGFFELLASSLATWAIIKIGVARSPVGEMGKVIPWLVFAVVMGHLAINHINTYIADTDGSTIEIAGSQMVLCMKLISFAWSIYDGQLPDSRLDATQRSTKITQVPDLIPFLGYCFFFPSIIAGPSFTYSSYIDFMTHDLFKKELKSDSAAKEKLTLPLGRRRKALKRLATGVIYLGIYSVYGSSLGYSRMLTSSFAAQSFAHRFFFINLAGFVARTKYYAVWCVAESSFIISGFGYNPATKHYDASRNVRIRSIELAPNFKILFDSWNMNTNVWLRECIYKRVAKEGKKPGFKSTQITFITSALWHGVNPCYILTFVFGGFCQSLGRSLRQLIRPFFLPPGSIPPRKPHHISATPLVPSTTPITPPKKILAPPQTPLKWAYDIIGILSTQAALNFAVAPFMLLSVKDSVACWKAVNYYGFFIVFGPIVVLHLGLAGFLKRTLMRRDARAVSREEREEEVKRVEWEKREEAKSEKRGEGIAALGMDVEELAEEGEEGKEKKVQ